MTLIPDERPKKLDFGSHFFQPKEEKFVKKELITMLGKNILLDLVPDVIPSEATMLCMWSFYDKNGNYHKGITMTKKPYNENPIWKFGWRYDVSMDTFVPKKENQLLARPFDSDATKRLLALMDYQWPMKDAAYVDKKIKDSSFPKK